MRRRRQGRRGRRRGRGRQQQLPWEAAAAAALSLINDAHHRGLPQNDRFDCGRGAKAKGSRIHETIERAAGQKIPRLGLRERQLTGVEVRRRRHRRRRRRRLRLEAEEGARRKKASRANELRPSERGQSFCAFFAGSIRSLGGRGRLDRESAREKEGPSKDGGGAAAQKVAPHFHFLPRRSRQLSILSLHSSPLVLMLDIISITMKCFVYQSPDTSLMGLLMSPVVVIL